MSQENDTRSLTRRADFDSKHREKRITSGRKLCFLVT